MGIGKLIEEAAGAVAAVEAVETADPNAGMLAKGAAAVAGFVGVGKLNDAVEGHIQHNRDAAQAAGQDAGQDAQDGSNPDNTDPNS